MSNVNPLLLFFSDVMRGFNLGNPELSHASELSPIAKQIVYSSRTWFCIDELTDFHVLHIISHVRTQRK